MTVKLDDLRELTKYLEELEKKMQKSEDIRIIAERARKDAEEARVIAEDARKKAESIRIEIFNRLKEVFETS